MNGVKHPETMKLTPQIAAMYLGCRVQTPDGLSILSAVYASGWCFVDEDKEEPDWYDFKNLKPILRRLESMTEEEAKECSITSYSLFSENAFWGTPNEWLPSEFLILLSKSFDLFGLIDSGEAIDAKILNRKD